MDDNDISDWETIEGDQRGSRRIQGGLDVSCRIPDSRGDRGFRVTLKAVFQ